MRSISGQSEVNHVGISGNTERKKSSPHTPFKEEKENVGTEVATLQQQQQQAAGAEISLSPDSSASEKSPAAAVTPAGTAAVIPAGTLDERRQRFWADCCHCHARHREWPAEAVKSFFLYWTQLTQDGQRFKFETEAVWGIGHRMKWYIVHGRWLDTAQAAKLERIRNGGGGSRRGKPAVSELERRRYEAANAEAEAVYDRYFSERNNP